MSLEKDKELNKKAKNAVFRLLKVRLRSEYELIEKLRNKNIPDEIIKETVKFFKNLEFINDRQFAKAWISSRLKKPYGSNRIRFELKNKGIAPEIIEEEINHATKEDYCELQVINQLAKRRCEKYRNIEPTKRYKRVFDYLTRRGFSAPNIMKAIRKL